METSIVKQAYDAGKDAGISIGMLMACKHLCEQAARREGRLGHAGFAEAADSLLDFAKKHSEDYLAANAARQPQDASEPVGAADGAPRAGNGS